MKAIAAVIALSLSFAAITATAASADPQFGTRGWFNSKLNSGG